MSEAKNPEFSTGPRIAIILIIFISIAAAIHYYLNNFYIPKREVGSFQTPDILIPTPYEEIKIEDYSSTDSGITIFTVDATSSSESASQKEKLQKP